jgi:hypothetical protein
MMNRVNRAVGIALALLLACSVAAATQTRQKRGSAAREQVWNVDFLVGDAHYTGTMRISESRGVVTGKMVIDAPTRIEADVKGKRAGDTVLFDHPYTMVQENCTGRVEINAAMPRNAQEASGKVHVIDCGGQDADGTVTMKRAAAAKGSD